MLNPHDLSHVKNFSFDRAFWLLEQLCWPEKALPRSVKPTDPHFATQVWPTCPLTTPRKWQENLSLACGGGSRWTVVQSLRRGG